MSKIHRLFGFGANVEDKEADTQPVEPRYLDVPQGVRLIAALDFVLPEGKIMPVTMAFDAVSSAGILQQIEAIREKILKIGGGEIRLPTQADYRRAEDAEYLELLEKYPPKGQA